mmetsp:Transcript_35222/g.54932  ORF Transcript_35222/g.54932 Transcript_35222/m.54932 type:complete len:126 (-) Transcript_35222:1483-1860(-)
MTYWIPRYGWRLLCARVADGPALGATSTVPASMAAVLSPGFALTYIISSAGHSGASGIGVVVGIAVVDDDVVGAAVVVVDELVGATLVVVDDEVGAAVVVEEEEVGAAVVLGAGTGGVEAGGSGA